MSKLSRSYNEVFVQQNESVSFNMKNSIATHVHVVDHSQPFFGYWKIPNKLHKPNPFSCCHAEECTNVVMIRRKQ